MKKGEIYQGTIDRVLFPNRGEVKLPEGRVIVKNGIPGQRVRFVINKKRKNRMEGRLLEDKMATLPDSAYRRVSVRKI